MRLIRTGLIGLSPVACAASAHGDAKVFVGLTKTRTRKVEADAHLVPSTRGGPGDERDIRAFACMKANITRSVP